MKTSTPYYKVIISISLLFFFSTGSAQDAASLIKKGDEYFFAGKYDSSISNYTKAIAADPKSYEAFYSRASAYSKKRMYNNAISDFTSAIKVVPADSTELAALFYTERGILLENRRAIDSAFLDYSKAISIHPSLEDVWIRRGEIFYNRYNFEMAVSDFSHALMLNPKNAATYRARSRSYYGLGQIDSALADISATMVFDSSSLNYNYRGVFYTNLGRYDSAIYDFMKSIKEDFIHGTPYINIISPLARLKRFHEASLFYNLYTDKLHLIREYTNGVSQFVAFVDNNKAYKFYNYYIKAVDLISDNNLQEAFQMLDSASITYGTQLKTETKRCYVDVLALRGYILEKLGKDDDAKVCYEQALIIEPLQPDVENALENMELRRTISKTRDIDKTSPEIKGVFADTSRATTQMAAKDSITIKIRGTAYDATGIKEVRVNDKLVKNVEEDGFFRFALKKKAGDRSPIIITATDSSGNKGSYTFSEEPTTRGGVMGRSSEETANPMGKFYAILIAEKDYLDPNLKDLNFPIRDANNLKKILIGKYTFDPQNVDTLYNRSREDILETIIARCKALGKRDNLLIFYAGHGDTTHDKDDHVDGYLIPTSAKKGLTSYFITSEEIKKALLRSNAQHVLLILDACYSGSFTRSGSDEITGDLAVQWQSPSRKVMTSGNLEAVPDQSYFIKYLTDFLSSNNKPFVSAKDLWGYVDKSMRDIPKEEDRKKFYNPQYSAITGVDDKGGSFIFVLRKQN